MAQHPKKNYGTVTFNAYVESQTAFLKIIDEHEEADTNCI